MTAWQSMFDGGACTVACRLKNPSQDEIRWSGTLAKGGTSPIFSGINDFGELQIAVDANGVTSLSSPDNSWTSAAMYALAVAPQYDVSTLQTQIADGSMPGAGPNNTALATNNGTVDEGGTECAVGDAGTLTPSTVAFDALADASLALWWGGS